MGMTMRCTSSVLIIVLRPTISIGGARSDGKPASASSTAARPVTTLPISAIPLWASASNVGKS